jgi:hypothetical protein
VSPSNRFGKIGGGPVNFPKALNNACQFNAALFVNRIYGVGDITLLK